PPVGALEDADISPGIEDGEGEGINDQGIDIGGRQASIDCAPATSSVGALEHAVRFSPGIESGGGDGVNGQGVVMGVEQAGVDCTPATSSVGALEHAAASSIEGGRSRRVNGQGATTDAGQDHPPGAPPVGALEHAATSPSIEG